MSRHWNAQEGSADKPTRCSECGETFDTYKGMRVHQSQAGHMDKPWKDEENLRKLYCEEELTTREIGSELGCEGTTVAHWIREYDIKKEEVPWKDEETLRDLYWDEGLTQDEIAEKWGCGSTTIGSWMEKFGIERRSSSDWKAVDELRDGDRLRQLYHDEELTQGEIADLFGCEQATVSRWMRRHGIGPGRGGWEGQGRIERAFFYTTLDGYETVGARYGYEKDQLQVHRLVAVAEHGFDAMVDKVVHHKNYIPWDNRPSNLEVLTDSEHKSLHATNRHKPPHERWGK